MHGGLLGDPEHPEIEDYHVEASLNGITIRNVRLWQPDPDGTGQAAPVTYEYKVLRPLTAYFCKQSNGRRFAIFFHVTPVNQEECIGWMWIAMNYAYEVPEADLRAAQDKLVAQDIAIVESQRPQRLPLDLQAPGASIERSRLDCLPQVAQTTRRHLRRHSLACNNL